MIFELFAAASVAGFEFFVSPRSYKYQAETGIVSAWVQEKDTANQKLSRYHLSSTCGDRIVTKTLELSYDGQRWVRTGNLQTLDLLDQENSHYAVLRQELCHYEK